MKILLTNLLPKNKKKNPEPAPTQPPTLEDFFSSSFFSPPKPIKKYPTNQFSVVNNHRNSVQVTITKNSNPNGDDAWFTIQPGATETWNRTGQEQIRIWYEAFSEDKLKKRPGRITIHGEHNFTFEEA